MAARRRSGRIFILLAIIIIAFIGIGVFLMRDRLLPQNNNTSMGAPVLPTSAPTSPTMMIVILKQTIPRNTVLSRDILDLVPYPVKQEDTYQGLFFSTIEEVEGKRAKFDLDQGTPLTRGLVTDTAVSSNAAAQIPPGKVAISIPIEALTSVSFALQPGDHVNVIGSFWVVDLDPNFQTTLPNSVAVVSKPGQVQSSATGDISSSEASVVTSSELITAQIVPAYQGRAELDATLNQPVYVIPSESKQRPRLVSQTIVQNAVVLWVGEFPSSGMPASSASSAAPAATPTAIPPTPVPGQNQAAAEPTTTPPTMISLIVTQQESLTINYFILSKADLNLVLRSAGDEAIEDTQAVTLQFIMDQYNVPYPSKLPYGIDTSSKNAIVPLVPNP